MREYYADQQSRTPPLSHSATFVVVTVLLAAVFVDRRQLDLLADDN